MRWYMPRLSPVLCWNFHFLAILRHAAKRADPSPGGPLFKAPARRVDHRRPIFRRGRKGLICAKGVEPPRGHPRPSRVRSRSCFFACDIKYFQRSFWTSPSLLPLPTSISIKDRIRLHQPRTGSSGGPLCRVRALEYQLGWSTVYRARKHNCIV